jgi:hypothetical protein
MVNQHTESNRINAIREKVREQAEQGLLGVVAGKARISEGMLYEWLEDCSKMPSQSELVSIQDAVGEAITLPNTLSY